MKHPADVIFRAVEDCMFEGSHKDGRDESWRDKGKKYHRMKAIRHLLQAQMIEDGIYPDDGEPHDRNAGTRTAMVLSLLESERRGSGAAIATAAFQPCG